LAIVDSLDPNGPASTKPGQLHCAFLRPVFLELEFAAVRCWDSVYAAPAFSARVIRASPTKQP
jgi:hypothetical protein